MNIELSKKEIEDALQFGELLDSNASNARVNAAALKVAHAITMKVEDKKAEGQSENDFSEEHF